MTNTAQLHLAMPISVLSDFDQATPLSDVAEYFDRLEVLGATALYVWTEDRVDLADRLQGASVYFRTDTEIRFRVPFLRTERSIYDGFNILIRPQMTETERMKIDASAWNFMRRWQYVKSDQVPRDLVAEDVGA